MVRTFAILPARQPEDLTMNSAMADRFCSSACPGSCSGSSDTSSQVARAPIEFIDQFFGPQAH